MKQPLQAGHDYLDAGRSRIMLTPAVALLTRGMTMAKKTEAQEEKQGDGKDGPKLADVVRQALGQLGTEASAGEVRTWVGRNYPGYDYNETTLGTTLSNQ